MLTINLSGRFDAENAQEVEAAISVDLAKCPGEVPEFDASGLKYISSAGLRVLLNFRKAFGKNLDVLNVSSNVYDIFDVTGFTELFNVKKRLREISLEGLDVIGGGAFSTVYRLDPETIVKVFTHHTATLSGAEKDRRISREVFLHDIPTAIAYDVVKAGENYGLVYEMIDADTLAGTLLKHTERLEELSIKTARLFRRLHTTEFERGVFPDARNRLHSIVQRVHDGEFITVEDKALFDEAIDRIPYRNTFVQTDFHPKNIMVSGDDLILIDVGDAGLGHPIIDFLFSYTQFVLLAGECAEYGSDIHERITGLDSKTLGAMWDIIMLEYFGTSDSETLRGYEEIMRSYASIFLMSICFKAKGRLPIELRQKVGGGALTRLREAANTLRPIDGI